MTSMCLIHLLRRERSFTLSVNKKKKKKDIHIIYKVQFYQELLQIHALLVMNKCVSHALWQIHNSFWFKNSNQQGEGKKRKGNSTNYLQTSLTGFLRAGHLQLSVVLITATENRTVSGTRNKEIRRVCVSPRPPAPVKILFLLCVEWERGIALPDS